MAIDWKAWVRRMGSRRMLSRPDSLAVELVGGLGNQLFGYAAGISQAQRLGCGLLMNHQSPPGTTSRGFELPWLLNSGATQGPTDTFRTVYQERDLGYDPAIQTVSRGTLLRGYFQSERYFAAPTELRRSLIEAAEAYFGTSLYGSFMHQDFIAVHIRRGDYSHEPYLSFHGLCSDAYYKSAVDELRTKVGDLQVVVFSDDAHGRSLGQSLFEGAVIHDETGLSAAETLLQMSRASALVISNSSFGWWAAWLSGSSHVIAPDPWYADPSLDTRDLLPPRWETHPRNP